MEQAISWINELGISWPMAMGLGLLAGIMAQLAVISRQLFALSRALRPDLFRCK